MQSTFSSEYSLLLLDFYRRRQYKEFTMRKRPTRFIAACLRSVNTVIEAVVNFSLKISIFPAIIQLSWFTARNTCTLSLNSFSSELVPVMSHIWAHSFDTMTSSNNTRRRPPRLSSTSAQPPSR